MFSDDIFIKTGGNFPYRRYQDGAVENSNKLRHLIHEYVPKYNIDGFDESKLKSKIVSVMPPDENVFSFFEIGPKNIATQNFWELNVVIDQYTETSRMNSPGYGKDMSPIDFWMGRTFSSKRNALMKGKQTVKDAREAIYENGEVRLAYVTDSIGLYNYIKLDLLQKTQNPTVVDITAFGDRLVAAAATGYSYIGIDPDPTLVDGISRLTLDVKTILPTFNVSTYTLPLEHFSLSHKVDLVSFSPPPYKAEPYEGGERQVHKVYKSYKHWFHGFICESLLRAKSWLREGGILAFSVLDRENDPKIIYTEAMILFAMKIGFRPRKIFTLSSSGGTPWWIFQKDSSFEDDKFDTFYAETLKIKEMTSNISAGIEYLRFLSVKYLIKACQEANIFVKPNKIADTIGRILMSKVPDKNDRDFIFPDKMSEIILNPEDFVQSKDVVLPIIFQTADAGYRKQITEMPENGTMELFVDMCDLIIDYLQWVQCTEEFSAFERNVFFDRDRFKMVGLYVLKQNSLSAISFIRKRSFFTSIELDKIKVFNNKVMLWNSNSTDETEPSLLRYHAVGVLAHHFTRPTSRIEAIKQVARFVPSDLDSDVVDLFATPFNANTTLYASVYPEIDPGSIDNFFAYDGGIHRVLMANPPSYKGFDEKMIYRLMDVYLESPKVDDRIIFYSTTVWEDTGSAFLDKIRDGKNPNFEKYDDNTPLNILWKTYKQYLRAVYILDHSIHPTFDPYSKKIIPLKTRATQSVGVILSTKTTNIDYFKLNLLASKNYFTFD